MSYRAFKRLLGETSLERKCRFLFGGFILLLITSSFWLYRQQTESLAYDRSRPPAALLVDEIVERQLATVCRPGRARAGPSRRRQETARRRPWTSSTATGSRRLLATCTTIFKPNATRQQDMPDPASLERIKAFQAEPDKYEDNHLRSVGQATTTTTPPSAPPSPA